MNHSPQKRGPSVDVKFDAACKLLNGGPKLKVWNASTSADLAATRPGSAVSKMRRLKISQWEMPTRRRDTRSMCEARISASNYGSKLPHFNTPTGPLIGGQRAGQRAPPAVAPLSTQAGSPWGMFFASRSGAATPDPLFSRNTAPVVRHSQHHARAKCGSLHGSVDG